MADRLLKKILLNKRLVTHSLCYLSTSIWEPGREQPTFFSEGYVDGYLTGLYDHNTRSVLLKTFWLKKCEEDNPQLWDLFTQRAQTDELLFIRDVMSLQKYYNQSGGIHILQRMIGCELHEDGRKVGYNQYGYNGRDFISFDKETLTFTAADAQAQVTKRKWDTDLARSEYFKSYLDKDCFDELHKFFEYGKEDLLRKEAPVVKVRCKAGYDGWETLICQAYGFYPKEINVTWRKDGEIWEQDTFHGVVSPNSDATYYTWLSIQIDPKDRDHFQCHVDHDSLPEPLVFACEESEKSPGGYIAGTRTKTQA
ncbi:class I histocompatibility antigen, F10 alpha chain-like [Hemicordylus capensis]|uniref:class I histocompatibility antigen, F10 alpha chain-like n=1 Tax=Hemicordylus capensis TaxID=884348 RepID=UPI002304B74C|nr:class I histocompatibility antigen, F10 alpha chain-like [Hemicordylus capensis]